MKRTLPYHILLALGLLLNFGCEKEEPIVEEQKGKPLPFQISKPGMNGYTASGTALYFPVEGADIRIFATEEDYIMDKNPVDQGKSDENGFYVFYRMKEGSEHWYRVKKGKLSNDRYASEERPCYAGYLKVNNYMEYNMSMAEVRMTTPPSKLQLTVMHNGQAVEGAQVQLYFSQEAYETDLQAHQDFDELLETYGFPEETGNFGSQTTKCLKETFSQTTDAEGVVYFPDLEAKKYWFRISSGELTNEGGTIQLEELLSEDPNITRSITVGIN